MDVEIHHHLASSANLPKVEALSVAEAEQQTYSLESFDETDSPCDQSKQKISQEICTTPAVEMSMLDPDDVSASSRLAPVVPGKGNGPCDGTTADNACGEVCGTLQEVSPTCVSKLQSRQLSIDDLKDSNAFLGGKSAVNSLFPDVDGADSDIQAAIDEIRKEASHIDAIMAIGQLETLRSELEVTTKALQERSAQAEDLKIQLEEMEERVACLELERDLFKADASKLKEDLRTCVDRMFEISLVNTDLRSENDQDRATQHATKQESPLSPTTAECKRLDSPSAAVQIDPSNYFPTMPSSRCANSGAAPFHSAQRIQTSFQRIPVAGDLEPSTRFPQKPSPRSRGKNHNPQTDSIFRRIGGGRCSMPIPPASSIRYMRAERQPLRGCTDSISVEKRAHNDSEIVGEQNRICGIFRRRQPRHMRSARNSDIEIMRRQICQLHTMMKTSLSTSEMLRSRLVVISRYYEGIIQKLQEQFAESKAQKKRMHDLLASQIYSIDREKRLEILRLETQLRCKEEEIARLRQKLI